MSAIFSHGHGAKDEEIKVPAHLLPALGHLVVYCLLNAVSVASVSEAILSGRPRRASGANYPARPVSCTSPFQPLLLFLPLLPSLFDGPTVSQPESPLRYGRSFAVSQLVIQGLLSSATARARAWARIVGSNMIIFDRAILLLVAPVPAVVVC